MCLDLTSAQQGMEDDSLAGCPDYWSKGGSMVVEFKKANVYRYGITPKVKHRRYWRCLPAYR